MKAPNNTPEQDRAEVKRICWEVYLNEDKSISIGIGPCWLPLFAGTAEDLAKALQETLDTFDPTVVYKYRYEAKGYTEPVPLDDGDEARRARAKSAIDEVVLACEPVIMSKQFFGRVDVRWRLDSEENGVKSGRFHYEVEISA